jgi:bifunctional non-homologous end joining protein LigD
MKREDQIRVFTRRGADWTKRFPRLVSAARSIKAESFLIDVEGIVYDSKGMPIFDLLHSHDYDKEVSLLAFDLLELSGTEVRKQPLVERKELLADLLKRVKDGIELSDHIEGDANVIFEHACKLGHEGIVVKRKDLPYESGRSKRWLKVKNPASPAMKRVEDGTF